MNTTTTKWIDVDKLAPLGDAEIWPLARAEYLRMLSLLRSLDEGEWPRPPPRPTRKAPDVRRCRLMRNGERTSRGAVRSGAPQAPGPL